MKSTLVFAALVVLAPSAARAQTLPGTQSSAEIAARDPAAAITAALGSARPLHRRAGAIVVPRRGAPPAVTVARVQLNRRPPALAPDAPPRCFLLLAVASAITDVPVTIRADRTIAARVGTIGAAASNGVSSTRFCVAASTMAIEASARSTTASAWAAAIIDAPPESTASSAPSNAGQGMRDRLAQILATERTGGSTSAGVGGGTASARIELGGRDVDFVGRQLRDAYGAVRGARATIEAERAQLSTSQERELRASLEAGRCYEAAVFAVPSVSDVDVTWLDPSGVRMAQDRGHQSNERVRFCPRVSGTHRVHVRVFSGSGALVMQVIEVPEAPAS